VERWTPSDPKENAETAEPGARQWVAQRPEAGFAQGKLEAPASVVVGLGLGIALAALLTWLFSRRKRGPR
jgi:LPXTG-motif cell wall-anchored protein